MGDTADSGSSLGTLAGVLLGLAVVLALVWWIVALSPVGLAGRFENTTGGDDIRTLLNDVFSASVGILLAGGLATGALALWRHRRRRG